MKSKKFLSDKQMIFVLLGLVGLLVLMGLIVTFALSSGNNASQTNTWQNGKNQPSSSSFPQEIVGTWYNVSSGTSDLSLTYTADGMVTITNPSVTATGQVTGLELIGEDTYRFTSFNGTVYPYTGFENSTEVTNPRQKIQLGFRLNRQLGKLYTLYWFSDTGDFSNVKPMEQEFTRVKSVTPIQSSTFSTSSRVDQESSTTELPAPYYTTSHTNPINRSTVDTTDLSQPQLRDWVYRGFMTVGLSDDIDKNITIENWMEGQLAYGGIYDRDNGQEIARFRVNTAGELETNYNSSDGSWRIVARTFAYPPAD